jgi:hypothetical protein
MKFSDMTAVACRSVHRDFEKAKERMLDGASLMGQCKFEGKDSKREKLEKTWDSASLRKETLKNRKEDFKSKVLKNCKGVRP